MGSTCNNSRRKTRPLSAPSVQEKPPSTPEKSPAAGANNELTKLLEKRRRWEQSDSHLQGTD